MLRGLLFSVFLLLFTNASPVAVPDGDPNAPILIEKLPWLIKDIRVKIAPTPEAPPPEVAANSITRTRQPSNSSIAFTFNDYNEGLELSGPCTGKLPFDYRENGMRTYFPCDGNDDVGYRINGNKLDVKRSYQDPR